MTMEEKMKLLTKKLPDEQLEIRVGFSSPYKGCSLLLYKDSRADVVRLNEVFGLRWKPEYRYDDKGNLICRIYAYDDEINEWIWREDIGTESSSDSEKGQYSDALKRAGFRFGIGIELYNKPFIWIADKNPDNWKKNTKGKVVYNGFVKDWKVISNENGDKIVDKFGNVMWTEKKNNSQKPDINKTVRQKKESEKINENQLKKINTLITKTGTDREKVKKTYNIKSLKDLDKSKADETIKNLEKKLNIQQKRGSNDYSK